MPYIPVNPSLTRNIKIEPFTHAISKAEAGLLESYKDRLDRLIQIKQQQKTNTLSSEVIEQCNKSEQLALEALQCVIQESQKNDYGLCQSCLKPIEEKRLTILPDIKHCFDCSH